MIAILSTGILIALAVIAALLWRVGEKLDAIIVRLSSRREWERK